MKKRYALIAFVIYLATSIFAIIPIGDLFFRLLIINLFNLLIYVYLNNKYNLGIFFRRKLEQKSILYTIIFTLISTLVISFIIKIFSVNLTNQNIIEKLFLNSNILILILSLCIIGPIQEEILFRGYIFNSTKNRYIGLMLSSIIFSLMHSPTNLMAFIVYFILGSVFGIVYLVSGSIELSILAHILNNSISLIELFKKGI